jgi:hypothetical protein
VAAERAQEALARDAHQQRAEPRQARERAQQREVVRERLAEADPRVELDPLLGHAGADRRLHPLGQERLDLRHHVLVARVGLHRARLAEHVHQAAVEAAVGDEAGEFRISQRGHVADERRRRLARPRATLGLAQIRPRRNALGSEPCDHRAARARELEPAETVERPGGSTRPSHPRSPPLGRHPEPMQGVRPWRSANAPPSENESGAR